MRFFELAKDLTQRRCGAEKKSQKSYPQITQMAQIFFES
ncbi:MAG: hypothetical protein GQF41_1682 [Candidatus Rifleibacterium amylolyticum]|nr:MAG: hypothetical protein GQF41_1682 [Candidatus Rifleibacterium amylolyticum]